MAQMYRHPTDPGAAQYPSPRAVCPRRGCSTRLARRGAIARAWRGDRRRTARPSERCGRPMRSRAFRVPGRRAVVDAHRARRAPLERGGRRDFSTRRGRERVRGDRINPANAVCDLRVDSPWPTLSSDPKWDWAGLQSRVHMEPGDGRACWIATATLPFDGARSLSDDASRRVPPAAGDRWRFNLFRIKRPGGAADPERDAVYAAWSVPDGPSFHAPDRFRDLVFG